MENGSTPVNALPPAEWPNIDHLVTESEEEYPLLTPEDYPDVENLVTEDDTPVDNYFSAKQQRLLVEPLYTSWQGPGDGRPFIADANVGLYYAVSRPPLVPDAFLSLDVEKPGDWWSKTHRCYMVWVMGKPPDVAIEIVSNLKGLELSRKLKDYANARVGYYVVFDPQHLLGAESVRAFSLNGGGYEPCAPELFAKVGLGVKLWTGTYEQGEATWLRWCDAQGDHLLTGAERAAKEHNLAEQEHQRAEQERQRAEQERQRAEQERQRAERLAEQLRAAGINPDV